MTVTGRCKICILFSAFLLFVSTRQIFFVMSAEEVKEHRFVANLFSHVIA